MSNLSPEHEEALKSLKGAKVLVVELNKQIEHHEKTIIKIQNESENWRERFHKSDKLAGILKSKSEVILIIEASKFITGAVSAYGFYLLGVRNAKAWYVVSASILIYIILLLLQKRQVNLKDE